VLNQSDITLLRLILKLGSGSNTILNSQLSLLKVSRIVHDRVLVGNDLALVHLTLTLKFLLLRPQEM
jgi:hypothetical protein